MNGQQQQQADVNLALRLLEELVVNTGRIAAALGGGRARPGGVTPDQACAVITAEVLHELVTDALADDAWSRWPDIGQDDWNTVAAALRQAAPAPAQQEISHAYALLGARAQRQQTGLTD